MEAPTTSRAADRKKRSRSAFKDDEGGEAEQQHQESLAADSGSAAAKSAARDDDGLPAVTRQRSASSDRPARKNKKRKANVGAEVIDVSPEATPMADGAAEAEVEQTAEAGPSSSSQTASDARDDGLAGDKGKTKAPGAVAEEGPDTEQASTQPAAASPSAAAAAVTASISTGDPQELQHEVERLRKELSTKNELIETQRSTIKHIYHQCTCTICLELVWRPFILAPCGHTFCVVCLMSWFTKPLDKEGDLPPGLNAEERAREEQRRTQRRKKTCPACRTELACPPVEIWLVKGMLEKLDSAARTVGTSDCGLPDDTLSSLEIAKARGEDLPAGPKLWEDIFDGRGPRRILYDEGDGVRRCGECASEIWEGVCSNPDCGIEYSDMSDDEYGSDLLLPSDDIHGHFGGYYGGEANGRRHRSPGSDGSRSRDSQFSDSEDDMRSFIEDDLDEDGRRHADDGDDDDEEDDGFIDGPRRIYRQAEAIEISDDEDEDDASTDTDDDGAGRRRRRRRFRSESTMTGSSRGSGREDAADDAIEVSSNSDVSHGYDDDEDGAHDHLRGRRGRGAAGGRLMDSDEESSGGESRRSDHDRAENDDDGDEDMSSIQGGSFAGSDRGEGSFETADGSHSSGSGGSSDGDSDGDGERRSARTGGSRRIIDSDDDDY
ncbi:uncharacterized protein PFL1_02872 [Pseudozyma flocculosa PF-1]|uniref:RING-type domain-containing protein n=2 Tax=Pseudozyma flocculosa TaxID=84751 RepID=A0A5C3F2B5_9BASI|nr:uncharacterized protein PFL1_02872 [Pseudozyma flocculosa PF-1]EPQ29652.1 hypothetical protein PFL1_02872 [Pseudozyma flocculosa PF-1]SPO38220.1 uncharacterized protein PSFLO_03697 [Pseudozyma flocculosa]